MATELEATPEVNADTAPLAADSGTQPADAGTDALESGTLDTGAQPSPAAGEAPDAPRETYVDKNGRLREKGTNKFLRADGTDDTPPAGETVEPDADASTDTGAPPSPEGEAEAPLEMHPWSFVAEGQSFTLGNSAVVPGVGLIVPEEQVDTLHRMLGRTIKAERVLEQRQQILSEAQQEVEFNKLAGQQWEHLAALVQEGKADEAYAMLIEFAQQLPVLKAEAKAQLLERQLQAREQASQPTQAQVYAEAKTYADEGLGEMLLTLRQEPWAKGATDEDVAEIARELYAQLDDIMVQQVVQTPRGPQTQWVPNAALAQRFMEFGLRKAAQARQHAAEVAAAKQRAEKQAARTKESISAPPAATGASSAPPPKHAPATPKTPEEYQAWLQKITRGA